MTSDKMPAPPSRAVKLCGTTAIDPPSSRLGSGRLAVELENGQLRYVRYGGVEVLRGIAFLVRDENWSTYSPQIENLDIQERAEGFAVSYRAVCSDARQRLAFEARITGSSDGTLVFTAVAMPETDFVTNRAGFVVLHPAGLSGEKLKVTHVDGSEEETRFPEAISPSQPVFNIRALAHEVAPGLWATCRMEGDAFEMKDQRNWDRRVVQDLRQAARPAVGIHARQGEPGTSSRSACLYSDTSNPTPKRPEARRQLVWARTFPPACRTSAWRCRRRRRRRRWPRLHPYVRWVPVSLSAASISAMASAS